MFEPEGIPSLDPEELARIHQRAPAGAMVVAGIATGLVFALWLLFYLVIFLPRGLLQ